MAALVADISASTANRHRCVSAESTDSVPRAARPVAAHHTQPPLYEHRRHRREATPSSISITMPAVPHPDLDVFGSGVWGIVDGFLGDEDHSWRLVSSPGRSSVDLDPTGARSGRQAGHRPAALAAQPRTWRPADAVKAYDDLAPCGGPGLGAPFLRPVPTSREQPPQNWPVWRSSPGIESGCHAGRSRPPALPEAPDPIVLPPRS
jgi:hypothetical protein